LPDVQDDCAIILNMRTANTFCNSVHRKAHCVGLRDEVVMSARTLTP
jgi:hypothetical protein